MAQTPARDIINMAEVDFRFYTGDIRNHANNTNALAGTGFDPIFGNVNGVPALISTPKGADQSWMLADQTEMTFEILFVPDMYHEGTEQVGTSYESTRLLAGDWNIGLFQDMGFGGSYDEKSKSGIWMAFNGNEMSDFYVYLQDFAAAANAISKHRGSLMHLIVSVRFTDGVSIEVTTCINGEVNTDTSSNVSDFNMTPAPTNVLLEPKNTVRICPVHLVRMWDSYMSDPLILQELFNEAKRVVPTATFPAVAAGTLEQSGPS